MESTIKTLATKEDIDDVSRHIIKTYAVIFKLIVVLSVAQVLAFLAIVLILRK